jgi:hypothetical protein
LRIFGGQKELDKVPFLAVLVSPMKYFRKFEVKFLVKRTINFLTNVVKVLSKFIVLSSTNTQFLLSIKSLKYSQNDQE